jgi:hypothetical protein
MKLNRYASDPYLFGRSSHSSAYSAPCTSCQGLSRRRNVCMAALFTHRVAGRGLLAPARPRPTEGVLEPVVEPVSGAPMRYSGSPPRKPGRCRAWTYGWSTGTLLGDPTRPLHNRDSYPGNHTHQPPARLHVESFALRTESRISQDGFESPEHENSTPPKTAWARGMNTDPLSPLLESGISKPLPQATGCL